LSAVPGLCEPVYRIPVVSAMCGALVVLLMSLPSAVHDLLYFDQEHLRQGMPLGLLTAHWLHADAEHLVWNLSALSVLAPVIEMYSRALLCWSLAVGTLCVDLLLVSPLCDLQRYCGLSGILNTLLGVALYVYWLQTRSRLVVVVAILGLVKIVLEIASGQAVFTDTHWPPFAMAHLAGIFAAPLAIWCTAVHRLLL
jgi:membrane associated rhomboid family serine protease